MSDYNHKLNLLDKLLKNNESSLKYNIMKFLDWKHCADCKGIFESNQMSHKSDNTNLCSDCELDRDVEYSLEQFYCWNDTGIFYYSDDEKLS